MYEWTGWHHSYEILMKQLDVGHMRKWLTPFSGFACKVIKIQHQAGWRQKGSMSTWWRRPFRLSLILCKKGSLTCSFICKENLLHICFKNMLFVLRIGNCTFVSQRCAVLTVARLTRTIRRRILLLRTSGTFHCCSQAWLLHSTANITKQTGRWNSAWLHYNVGHLICYRT